ncbi:hypothetical protein EOD39_21839 [Acipenser ruthenus]|uniref:Uncharacterized protein n=1 Tax=Acipenser ruthenus TaxID=7906 RepID=A0A444URM7_ACIRT|nr:hypothetical protein EOD39_21839 [Acipenser ruthenus]
MQDPAPTREEPERPTPIREETERPACTRGAHEQPTPSEEIWDWLLNPKVDLMEGLPMAIDLMWARDVERWEAWEHQHCPASLSAIAAMVYNYQAADMGMHVKVSGSKQLSNAKTSVIITAALRYEKPLTPTWVYFGPGAKLQNYKFRAIHMQEFQKAYSSGIT